MGGHITILAYVAPEVILPLASALAGVFGVIMMVGRAPFRFAARNFHSIKKRLRPISRGSEPRGTRPPQAP